MRRRPPSFATVCLSVLGGKRDPSAVDSSREEALFCGLFFGLRGLLLHKRGLSQKKALKMNVCFRKAEEDMIGHICPLLLEGCIINGILFPRTSVLSNLIMSRADLLE